MFFMKTEDHQRNADLTQKNVHKNDCYFSRLELYLNVQTSNEKFAHLRFLTFKKKIR